MITARGSLRAAKAVRAEEKDGQRDAWSRLWRPWYDGDLPLTT